LTLEGLSLLGQLEGDPRLPPRQASSDHSRHADAMTDESRREHWEVKAEWPLTLTAVLFLFAYATPILRPDLADPWPAVCQVVVWAAWALFVLDYVARLVLSRDRLAFVRHNLFDLAIVALPLLRPLRLLRLVVLLSVLNRAAGGSLRGRVAVYVVGATSLILFVSSLAVLEAERAERAPRSRRLAMRCGGRRQRLRPSATATGTRSPQGRYIAGGLMLAGIALLGIVTATLATWLLDKVREVEEQAQTATRADVAALAAEVRALRAELAESGPSV
jgi:voltage-gated potassium channel